MDEYQHSAAAPPLEQVMKDTIRHTPSTYNADVERVGQQLAERLRTRGVFVHEKDTPDELGSLTEAVEIFEAAVESRGGDLMMDEPPAGHKAQPDNAAFVLPVRETHECVNSFISRIEAATARLRT